MKIKLPTHNSLSIEHNHHKSEGESLALWLQQLGVRPSDFASEEARQRAVAADELWILQWQGADGAKFLLAPTLTDLMQFAQDRLCDHMIDFD